MKMYVITNGTNGADPSAFWYERDIGSLEEALAKAHEYPGANTICEFAYTWKPKGWIPTGRLWDVKK